MHTFDLHVLENHQATSIHEVYTGDFHGAVERARAIIKAMHSIYPAKEFSVKLMPVEKKHEGDYYYVTATSLTDANYQPVSASKKL